MGVGGGREGQQVKGWFYLELCYIITTPSPDSGRWGHLGNCGGQVGSWELWGYHAYRTVTHTVTRVCTPNWLYIARPHALRVHKVRLSRGMSMMVRSSRDVSMMVRASRGVYIYIYIFT